MRFAGIGGARMSAAGLQSLFDPRELALLGIFEVVPAFRRVLGRVRETLDDIAGCKPDVLVTIDSWGFTGRIHERLLAKAGSTMPLSCGAMSRRRSGPGVRAARSNWRAGFIIC